MIMRRTSDRGGHSRPTTDSNGPASPAAQPERWAHTKEPRGWGGIVAVTRKTRTAEGVRPPAFFKHLVGLVLFGGLLGGAFTTEAEPSSNVALSHARRFTTPPRASRSPSRSGIRPAAAPAPLFLTGVPLRPAGCPRCSAG